VGRDTMNSIRYSYNGNVLLSKIPMVEGERHGLVAEYFINGKMKHMTNFKKGKVHGEQYKYDKFGRLLRRSFYIDNKHVLYEYTERNKPKTADIKWVLARYNGDDWTWAGELFSNFKDSTIHENYGHYIEKNIIYRDTLLAKAVIELLITIPTYEHFAKLYVGRFDKNLVIQDTLHYAELDTYNNKYSFECDLSMWDESDIMGCLFYSDDGNVYRKMFFF
jgi:hypothetical protein